MSFETKVQTKAYTRMGMKIYTNELEYMTKMATMPIFGKHLKIFFFRTNGPMVLELGV